MKISELSIEERPREKLLGRGAQALSDGELLAILLRSGRRGESAIELGQRLLSLTDGRLTGLFDCDAEYLAGMKGVGTARAATLLAAFELGRRFMMEEHAGSEPIRSAHQVFHLMLPRLKGLRREECWLLLLNRRGELQASVKMTIGDSRNTIIDIPAIVRNAIERGSSSVILVHNHPSGDPSPSNADIRETSALRDACISCSINLLDHIIIANDHFYSFNEEKMF